MSFTETHTCSHQHGNDVGGQHIKYAVNYMVPVDVSFSALTTLYNLGYRRVSFVLSEAHNVRDVCDKIYNMYGFGKNRFMQLSTLINNAPIFGSNPPAPLYGLTHPNCRCHFLVFPPKNLRDLTIPGQRLTVQQKEVLLSYMYPQEVNALSYAPSVTDIDFDAYIDSKQREPKIESSLQSEPWYQQVWDFVKKKIFRKSVLDGSGLYRYSSSIFNYGDIVKLLDDYTVTDGIIYTKVPDGSFGFVLSEYPTNPNYYLVFFTEYAFIRIVPGNLLVKVYDEPGLKGYYFDKKLGDYIEVPILRKLGEIVRIYNPLINKFQEVSDAEIKET
ncbi:MAG: hypothetical protein ABIK31_03290 [candidate division WOR-3 bacterium]